MRLLELLDHHALLLQVLAEALAQASDELHGDDDFAPLVEPLLVLRRDFQ